MELIQEKKFNKTINKEFVWEFEIARDAFYGIEITASAKSWQQNLKKLRFFFKDDDLTVRIDKFEFPQKRTKRKRLFDGEVAWNGNNLHGLKKTDLFLIKLARGTHKITFMNDQSPKIETVRIYQLRDSEQEISYLPKDNYLIEDGNRRQWLTIILVNIDLQFLNIKIKPKQGKDFLVFKKDDSDIKLIINGEIQRTGEKFHKDWYWCGWRDKGKEKSFKKELNFMPGLHYIELWADRNPEVKEIVCKFNVEGQKIREYKFKGIKGDEDYNRFDLEIIEAVKFWNDEFSEQKYPPKELLDPSLVKAMIYIESRIGYYELPKGYYPAYPDIMQVANSEDPAIHTLNNDGWIDQNTKEIAREYEWKDGMGKEGEVLDYHGKANANTFKESIKWGVRWLYHKAQGITNDGKRYWRSWEEALMNYRSKGDKEYQNKVFNIYRNGVDPDGNKLWLKKSLKKVFKKTFLISIFILFFIITGVSIISLTDIYRNSDPDSDIVLIDTRVPESKLLASIRKAVSSHHINIVKKIPIKNTSFFLGFIDNDFYSSALGMVILNNKHRIIELFKPVSVFYSSWDTTREWQDQWELGEYTDQLIIDDINKDGKIEIAVEMIYSGSGLSHPFYIYQLNGKDPKLILYLKDGVSDVQLKDFNNDNIQEIYYSFVLDSTGAAGRSLTPWKEIWAWQEGEYQKINHLYPEIYHDLVEYYNDLLINFEDQSMIYYGPIIECLKEKAELNIKGIFADGRECVM